MRNRVSVDSQAFAQMSKAFVISACGTVDEPMIRMLGAVPEAEKFLRNPDCCGGSVIVAPNSRILAGPMGPEEGILYAECDIEMGIRMKLRHDFAGHYNRPDVFRLEINRSLPKIYTVHGSEETQTLAKAADGLRELPEAAPTLPEGGGERLLEPVRAARRRRLARPRLRGVPGGKGATRR
jgi:aliphatic nitrilase